MLLHLHTQHRMLCRMLCSPANAYFVKQMLDLFYQATADSILQFTYSCSFLFYKSLTAQHFISVMHAQANAAIYCSTSSCKCISRNLIHQAIGAAQNLYIQWHIHRLLFNYSKQEAQPVKQTTFTQRIAFYYSASFYICNSCCRFLFLDIVLLVSPLTFIIQTSSPLRSAGK